MRGRPISTLSYSLHAEKFQLMIEQFWTEGRKFRHRPPPTTVNKASHDKICRFFQTESQKNVRGVGLTTYRANEGPASDTKGTIGAGGSNIGNVDGPGRSGRARTYDPRFWRPVLYQLSYTPRGSNVAADPGCFKHRERPHCKGEALDRVLCAPDVSVRRRRPVCSPVANPRPFAALP